MFAGIGERMEELIPLARVSSSLQHAQVQKSHLANVVRRLKCPVANVVQFQTSLKCCLHDSKMLNCRNLLSQMLAVVSNVKFQMLSSFKRLSNVAVVNLKCSAADISSRKCCPVQTQLFCLSFCLSFRRSFSRSFCLSCCPRFCRNSLCPSFCLGCCLSFCLSFCPSFCQLLPQVLARAAV